MGSCISTNSIKEKRSELMELTHNVKLFSFEGELHMAKVTKCYDGDTVHCVFKHKGQYYRYKIRMYGYNSCEMNSHDKISKQKAIAAKNRITELIFNKIVYLQCMHFDKYGRIVGEIKLKKNDKESVNDLMLRESHGDPFMQNKK